MDPAHGGFTVKEAQIVCTVELPAYLAANQDMDFSAWYDPKHANKLNVEKLRLWWVSHKNVWPKMFEYVHIMFTLVPHMQLLCRANVLQHEPNE